jgi:hypothetical protein
VCGIFHARFCPSTMEVSDNSIRFSITITGTPVSYLWIGSSIRAKSIYGLFEQKLPEVLANELDDLKLLTIGSTRYLFFESHTFSVFAVSRTRIQMVQT